METSPQKNDYKKALLWSCEIFGLENREYADLEKLREVLSNYLNRIIIEDFNKLIAILYRIDIPEGKARAALAAKKEEESAGEILTDLIIERQLQKIKTWRKYS